MAEGYDGHVGGCVESPELNLIQHVWDALGRASETRKHTPRTIQGLKIALLNEWKLLTQELKLPCLQYEIAV